MNPSCPHRGYCLRRRGHHILSWRLNINLANVRTWTRRVNHRRKTVLIVHSVFLVVLGSNAPGNSRCAKHNKSARARESVTSTIAHAITRFEFK
ncbi:uncharacterized protein K489DRAFT_7025 [Dissoconium aciculare CBS 342.82]|uniref:Uncharacterized protein n=1 Tax=Dissoconium aciculare CBS 342.82 TaxID=1314786 RepID=A0A6J3MGY0_9PEZI|nr:uncharacterized protein K489DRAFT_7025 [Dissoconium aciculare CBS 342.82]KAF1827123.1 hypothetical protein K489DRAFT_7025 [Dissoconium aciculare CBS 342.82]